MSTNSEWSELPLYFYRPRKLSMNIYEYKLVEYVQFHSFLCFVRVLVCVPAKMAHRAFQIYCKDSSSEVPVACFLINSSDGIVLYFGSHNIVLFWSSLQWRCTTRFLSCRSLQSGPTIRVFRCIYV